MFLTGAEDATLLMSKLLVAFAEVRPPFDGDKKRALEFCLENQESIRRAVHLGLNSIPDPVRRARIREILGPPYQHPPDEYGFNVWVIDACMGHRQAAPQNALYRCPECTRLRTNRMMVSKICPCGSARIKPVKSFHTVHAMKALATGY